MRVCRWGRCSAHTPVGPGARNPGGGKGPPDLPGEPGAGVGAPASFPRGDRPHLHLLAHEPGTRISSRPRDFSRTHRVNFLLFPPRGRNSSLVPEETVEGGGQPLRTAAVCPALSPHCSGLTLEKKNKRKKEHGSCHAQSHSGSLVRVQSLEVKAWCGIADHGTGH